MLLLRRLFVMLCAIFAVAYPIAVIGVAFDVRPPFSLAWAASALLFLEGTLLIVVTILLYGWLRGLYASLAVILLAYLVEAVGVATGFPFGGYHYTDVLQPILPGSVPLAVTFAWVLVVLGVYSWLRIQRNVINMPYLLLGALLALLLDLEIEPVAARIEAYWVWGTTKVPTYYGVPLANFAAWFIVAFLLLLLVNVILGHKQANSKMNMPLVLLIARLLFAASVFMFFLVDFTHGYYLASIPGPLVWLIMYSTTVYRTRVAIFNPPRRTI